jgi:hypothetical protein
MQGFRYHKYLPENVSNARRDLVAEADPECLRCAAFVPSSDQSFRHLIIILMLLEVG